MPTSCSPAYQITPDDLDMLRDAGSNAADLIRHMRSAVHDPSDPTAYASMLDAFEVAARYLQTADARQIAH